VALDPSYAPAYTGLALAQREQRKLAEAVATMRRAVALAPDDSRAHGNLGTLLAESGDPAGAVAAFRRAIALNPRNAKAHFNLGLTLYKCKEFAAATASLHRAIELAPEFPSPHYVLGMVRKELGDRERALSAFRRATELDDRNALAHFELGLLLFDRDDFAGAVAALRRATALDPKNVRAHVSLSMALRGRGDAAGAVAAARRALALSPRYLLAEIALALALLQQGEFREARAAFERAVALLPPTAPLRRKLQAQAEQCGRLLELERKLPAVLDGKQKPASEEERLELAVLCQDYKQRYAAAARLYADAFTADPKLVKDPRGGHVTRAARAAVLAAAGRGTDAGKLGAAEQTRLRHLALVWLRADLDAWAKLLDKSPAEVGRALGGWQKEADFAPVRDPKALAQLPAGERAAWEKFWEDVAGLLRRAAPE
jgi:tetratricopeptide (TPR) repeat protein